MTKLSEEEKQERLEKRKLEKWEREHKLIDNVDHKLCSKCNKWKPSNENYYYKNKSNNIDGLHPYCKQCAIEGSSKYTKDNKQWYQDYQKQWREDNKEIKQELDRQWYQNNKDYRRSYMGDWQSNNTDKLSKYRLTYMSNKKHEISKNEWKACKEYFNNQCAYCGMSYDDHKDVFNEDLHKEHVEDNGTNDLSNCVPSCKSCNSKKKKLGLEEWYNETNLTFNKNKLIKIIKWLNEDYLYYIKRKTNK